MKTISLIIAGWLLVFVSADNSTTTGNSTETTSLPAPTDGNDQTDKRSALAGNADYESAEQRQFPYPGGYSGPEPYGNDNPNQGTYYNDHGYENVIPGTAVRDYPIYAHPPITHFSCRGLPAGLYADLESRCQAWHICQADGRHDRFLCPNGTLFNQKFLVCDWWYNVECSRSSDYIGGSPYPPYYPGKQAPQPSPPKKPSLPKTTQKPYYPPIQPNLPFYPPQVPIAPPQPYIPQLPQHPYPPKIPQQPYNPEVPQTPFYPPHGTQLPYPIPQQPYGPIQPYPQEPNVPYPGGYYPTDIGSGGISRSSFPLYKTSASNKETANFPTQRKISGNEEDEEPIQY